jgi:hypothetical protein
MIHGSVSAAAPVNDPLFFSNAQKKRVALGWPARPTPTFPAKLLGTAPVIFGKAPVTLKSAFLGYKVRNI